MKLIPTTVVRGYLALFTPVGSWLAHRGVSPNSITLVGTLLWLLGAWLYAIGEIRVGGWLLGLTAFFDVIDGQVARITGKASAFGAFVDSTLDRVSDAAVFCGLAWFFATDSVHANSTVAVMCIVALVGAQMVSYTRARAESLGIECKTGFMQRPERVVLLSAPMAFFGLMWNGAVVVLVVAVLALAAWVTVLERVVAVYRGASAINAGVANSEGREL